MRKIIKGRWVILAIWLLATVLLTAFQPDINSIIRVKGTQALTTNSPSVISDAILSKMDTAKGADDLIVFYNKNKISTDEMNQISDSVKAIRASSTELNITKIIDPFSMPQAKSALVSKDGTTLMVSFKLNKKLREVDDIKKALDTKLSNIKGEYYISGQDFINFDYQKASEAGVTKSAGLTILFILLVLILVFRSVITPIISLLTVAFAYICSMGISAQLIDKANFPVTSLTQILLILVLFGIGTDYNILLFNRFKEELTHGHSTDDAIVNTYKTAGKTIAFSILTVFIAFLSLGFAESPIYRSGLAVVIGTAILLLEIITLTPLVMKVLGNKLFWPSKKAVGHKESKTWHTMAKTSAKHPIIAVLAVALLIGSTVYFHEQKLNFDTVKELGNSYPSSKAINIVSEHFGNGDSMPTTVVIENSKALDNNESLSVIDNLTGSIRSIKGVKIVSSVTQPESKPNDGFYIGGQKSAVTDGLVASQTGLNTNKTFFIPKEAFASVGIKTVLDMFMTSDRTITKMTIILKDDPYSKAALNTIKQINETISSGIKGTVLSNAKFGASGQSSYTKDLDDILTRDLNKVKIIVLIGVFLVLVLVIRAFWTPVFITASLMGAYYAAMFILNCIFINLKGDAGISSFVPFFSFIIIVALGVDYSIFLMMRYKEYPNMSPKDAIVLASRHIGGVVMSAGLILGGTFATLIPSGILLLQEWAVAVMTGLLVLCFLLLPIFLPAMLTIQSNLSKLFARNKQQLNSDEKVA